MARAGNEFLRMSTSPKPVVSRNLRPDLIVVSSSGTAMFSMLPQPRLRWKQFLCGYGVTGVCIGLLTLIGVLRPHIITETVKQYHIVALVDNPPPVNHKPAPIRVIEQPRVVSELKDPIPNNLRLTAPKPKPQVQDEVAPKVQLPAEKAPIPAARPVIPREPVRTNVFSTGSSAVPTIAAAPSKVQTGGFGDPNGVPASENRGRAVNIAQLGSFDLPSGPGYGNGSGGAKGIKGVVASAGFGNGVATGDGSGKISSSRGTVRQGGFGDADVPAAVPVRLKQVEPADKLTQVEIISKPTPAYTDEARKLKIEGEVLLEVVFEASGKLHVVRVVRGLGHGLDENAIRAAEQIHFKPAQKAGQPADFTATLHIVFQLA
jgi:TonB family protein